MLVRHMEAGSDGVYARIAPDAVLSASLSFPPPETLAEVQAAIETAVCETGAADDWLCDHPPRLEFVSGVTGAETPVGDPLYRVVAEAIRQVTGETPFVNPLHTSSDIRNPIVQAGIRPRAGPVGGDIIRTDFRRMGRRRRSEGGESRRRGNQGWCGVADRREKPGSASNCIRSGDRLGD